MSLSAVRPVPSPFHTRCPPALLLIPPPSPGAKETERLDAAQEHTLGVEGARASGTPEEDLALFCKQPRASDLDSPRHRRAEGPTPRHHHSCSSDWGTPSARGRVSRHSTRDGETSVSDHALEEAGRVSTTDDLQTVRDRLARAGGHDDTWRKETKSYANNSDSSTRWKDTSVAACASMAQRASRDNDQDVGSDREGGPPFGSGPADEDLYSLAEETCGPAQEGEGEGERGKGKSGQGKGRRQRRVWMLASDSSDPAKEKFLEAARQRRARRDRAKRRSSPTSVAAPVKDSAGMREKEGEGASHSREHQGAEQEHGIPRCSAEAIRTNQPPDVTSEQVGALIRWPSDLTGSEAGSPRKASAFPGGIGSRPSALSKAISEGSGTRGNTLSKTKAAAAPHCFSSALLEATLVEAEHAITRWSPGPLEPGSCRLDACRGSSPNDACARVPVEKVSQEHAHGDAGNGSAAASMSRGEHHETPAAEESQQPPDHGKVMNSVSPKARHSIRAANELLRFAVSNWQRTKREAIEASMSS